MDNLEVSGRRLARILGIKESELRRFVSEGRMPAPVDAKHDVEKGVQAYIELVLARVQPDDVQESIRREQLRKLQIANNSEEEALDERRGNLKHFSEFQDFTRSVVEICRRNLENMAGRLAPRLANKDARTCGVILEEETNNIRRELHANLAKAIGERWPTNEEGQK